MTTLPTPLDDWLARLERGHPRDIELGLERVRAVAARLLPEHPRTRARTITVAGTNGKGSTVAFIESIARAAGLRTGTYTSPHLLRYNERVHIDGGDADDAVLVEALAAVEAARSDVPLTYFEHGTLAALWLFARAGLDLVVLEVGLGGRLDATNLVDPDVAVITTVDLDHQDWLGRDRETIGAEKAGIARAWKPLVIGDDDPPSSVLGHAYAIGASAIRAGCDFFFERLDDAHWRWHELNDEMILPLPVLDAPVQLRNAAVAIAALRALGAGIPLQAFAAGVAAATLPGRLQRFDRDGVEIRVDVGHNPQAAAELAAWLRAVPVRGRTLAVYAALGDKDVAGVATVLADGVDGWWLAGTRDVGGRGIAVDMLAQRLAGTDAGRGERHADVAEALAAAQAVAGVGDRILVFGSFHAAAAAIALLTSDRPEGSQGGV